MPPKGKDIRLSSTAVFIILLARHPPVNEFGEPFSFLSHIGRNETAVLFSNEQQLMECTKKNMRTILFFGNPQRCSALKNKRASAMIADNVSDSQIIYNLFFRPKQRPLKQK